MDLLQATLRSLRAHALRFGLTSLGIVWGAFLLTFLSASIEGLDTHYTRELEKAGPKFVIALPGALIKNRVGERGARAVVLENEDMSRVGALHSIEDAAPNLALWNQVVRANGRTKLFQVQGVAPRSAALRNLVPREGRFLSPLDLERGERVAYLGPEAAKRLYGETSSIGQTLQIESLRFRVIGVGEPKGDQMIRINGWDDWTVFIPYTVAQRWLLQHDRIDMAIFAPVTRERSWEAIGHFREIVGLHHDFAPDLDAALSFFNVHEALEIVHTLFLGFRIFLVTAGAVTLLIGAIGVMNIMLVVVGERTHEIGLRKAVGATDRSIFLQFLAEAASVCGLSGILGAALGVGFTRLIAAVAPAGSHFTSPPELSAATVTLIATSLAVVGIVAGVLPALRAARVPPAEALRAT